MAIITGVPGDDELFGTPDNDEFRLFAPGGFIASGLGGNDQFIFRGNFTLADRVDGGTGKDTIQLDGDYSGANAIGFAANDMLRIEVMALRAGHGYDITPPYGGASQSTGTTRDTVSDVDALVDVFDLDFIVTGVVNSSGDMTEATFDVDLGSAVDDVIGLNGVALVLATGGDLDGRTFLVGDADGDGSYMAGTDYVIDITGFTGTITARNFT